MHVLAGLTLFQPGFNLVSTWFQPDLAGAGGGRHGGRPEFPGEPGGPMMAQFQAAGPGIPGQLADGLAPSRLLPPELIPPEVPFAPAGRRRDVRFCRDRDLSSCPHNKHLNALCQYAMSTLLHIAVAHPVEWPAKCF